MDETQTSPRSSLTEETRRQAVREWRMVNNCCLNCGRESHKARRCPDKANLPTTASPVAGQASVASSSAQTSHLHIPRPRIPDSQPPSRRHSDSELFDQWYTGRNPARTDLSKVEDANGWLPMVKVLPALAENKNNAIRYLDADSDTSRKRKLWVLGPDEQEPEHGRDWMQIESKKGGGYLKQGAYHCKKSCLKKVLLKRYKHLLPKQ